MSNKVKEYDSIFTSVKICTECDWFEKPAYRIYCQHICCPKCGANVTHKIGTYRIRETKRFLDFPDIDQIGFTPREPQP